MVMSVPIAKVRARSPSGKSQCMFVVCREDVHTILGEQVLEVVQVAVVISRLLSNWDEEADQEQDHADGDEDDGVLERAPESAAEGLGAVLGGHLVVFFIPKVGEWHD